MNLILVFFGLFVLFDVEIWFDWIDIIWVLDMVIIIGCIMLMVIMGIDNINEFDCMNILGGNKEFIFDIVENLIF